MSGLEAPAIDLDGVAHVLARCGPTDLDLDRLDVDYLKLRATGPVLALLQVPTTTGETHRLTARWTDPGKGARLAERLNDHYRRYYHHPGRTAVLGPGRAAIHALHLGLVLIAFPFDRRLPSLPLIADGRCLRGRLQSALSPMNGGTEIEAIDIQPVRYKPEGKCVFRIELRWASVDPALPAVVYAKVAKDAVFRRTDQVGPALSQLGPDVEFVLSRRLAAIDDLNLEIQTEVPGRPMSDLLAVGAGRGLGRRVGRALRSLHRTAARPPATRTVEDHLSLLADNGEQLARFRPVTGPTVQRLRAEITRRLQAAAPVEGRLCHNDFHGGNVLVGPSLGLIDFEDAAIGDPANDVGSMYAHLTEYAHLTDLAAADPGPDRGILAEREGFVTGYDVADLGGRFAPYAAGHLVLLAYQSLRYPAPDTDRRIERLLSSAGEVLDGARP